MKTTTIRPALTGEKKVMKQANDLMRKYALLNQSRQDLLSSIMDELKGYEKELKETEQKLIEIGDKNRLLFDEKKNMHLDDGYLHIEENTVIVTSKKFRFAQLLAAHPELVDYKLKVAPIKKAFLNEDMRKELKVLGVSTNTEEKVKVILSKDNTGREAKE